MPSGLENIAFLLSTLLLAFTITALHDCPLAWGTIYKVTEPLSKHILFENHTERITFLFVDSPVYPLVLGHIWLVQNNPHIKWGGGARLILQWPSQCNFQGHSTPPCTSSTLPIRVDSISESNSEEAHSHCSQDNSSVYSGTVVKVSSGIP